MSVPSKVTGGSNNSVAQNVLRITFSQALSAPPRLEGWDDSTFSTTVKEVFAGTAINASKPEVSAVATTDSAPASAWKPAAVVAGGAVINRLLGSTNYVNLSAAAPGAGGTVRFNLCWEIPSDASVPATNTMNLVFGIRLSYSGAVPSLTWAFNDNSAGGTEGAPVWTTITPGSAGNFARPADAGVSSGAIIITKPTSGTVDSGEVWIAAS